MIKKHRYKVGKLIRDKIPEILREGNIVVSARRMEKDEYIRCLKDKLLEEAKETIKSNTQNDFKEELADMLEVIHALIDAHNLSYQEIEDVRLQKKNEKGGFEERIYNASVEMDADNKAVDYYKKRPDDYPEISDVSMSQDY
jgi:predicted house-cleaning noncanonical NTP pyrophosphatase (MazG superfamily)